MMRKWRAKPRVVIHETGEKNEKLDEFIENEIVKKQWPYNIILGHTESEFVIRKTKDYLMLPDIENCESVHWLILFSDTSLRSIRSLRGCHLPLLKEISDAVKRINPRLLLYFHYPPSVWQLHLHVVGPMHALRTTSDMQRVHFLPDVMRNLEIDPEYYAKATLTYVLPEYHDLVTSVYREISPTCE